MALNSKPKYYQHSNSTLVNIFIAQNCLAVFLLTSYSESEPNKQVIPVLFLCSCIDLLAVVREGGVKQFGFITSLK